MNAVIKKKRLFKKKRKQCNIKWRKLEGKSFVLLHWSYFEKQPNHYVNFEHYRKHLTTLVKTVFLNAVLGSWNQKYILTCLRLPYWYSIYYKPGCVKQWFSNLSFYQNYLESLLKWPPGAIPGVSDSASLESAQIFPSLASSRWRWCFWSRNCTLKTAN